MSLKKILIRVLISEIVFYVQFNEGDLDTDVCDFRASSNSD